MDFLVSLKEQDVILNHKKVPFQQKLDSIIKIWTTIVSTDLSHCELENIVHVVDWAILHTLNLVLHADWNSWHENYEMNLMNEVERAKSVLVQRRYAFHRRCEKVTHVLQNPWSNPVLLRVMRMEDIEVDQEIVDLLCFEETHLISVRLNKLCESCCEDLALNLVKAYFKTCESLKHVDNVLNATQDQMLFMFDLRLVLLYKFKHYQELQEIIEYMPLRECLILVKRFARKKVNFLRTWKYSHKTAMLAIQIRLNKIIVSYDETSDTEDLNILMESYIDFCFQDNVLPNVCRYLQHISSYVNSSVVYKICEMLHYKHGSQLKSLIIELFIRGLTCDINELEKEKLDDSHRAIESAKRLASKFGMLAIILEESVEVVRECLLTAFSLNPTKEFLEQIEGMARRSGFQVTEEENEWKCKLHPPALPSDQIAWKCPECQEWMCKPLSDISLATNLALNEAIKHTNLNLPESLCDDLIVCLSSPRYRILNWSLPWDVLHRLCIMYYKDPNATRNLVTELKYVDIDYSIFDNIKQEPPDEYSGIEKGFEKYLNNDYSPIENNVISNDNDEEEISIENSMEVQTIGTESLRRYSGEGDPQEENTAVDFADNDGAITEKHYTAEPKPLHRNIRRRKTKKRVDQAYDPNSLTSLRKYLRSKESKREISSLRRYYKRTADELKSNMEGAAEKFPPESKKSTKTVQTKRVHEKKHFKKKQMFHDENYDPNSLRSLKKYIKSKQLKKEISSTRKFYKKSFEASQFYNTRTNDTKDLVGKEKPEKESKDISEEEKNDVMDDAEKRLQSFVEGEEYDPNSIDSLRKCVDLEKSKEDLLSKLRKNSMESNSHHSAARRDKSEEFEREWCNFKETTKNSFDFLKDSQYFMLPNK